MIKESEIKSILEELVSEAIENVSVDGTLTEHVNDITISPPDDMDKLINDCVIKLIRKII